MKQILTLYILAFFILNAKGQIECEYIKLCSQSQVDSFPKKYGHCPKMFSVEIDDNCNWVYNLDSLYQIEELGELIIQRMDSLHSISGLNNLVKVGRFKMIQLNNFEPFLNLDTINNLSFHFARQQLDLSLFSKIKHIDSSLSVVGSGKLLGLTSFTSKNGFNITVYNNKISNTTANLIPTNIVDFGQFVFTRNENVTIKGILPNAKIRRVIIDLNKSCDYTSMNILSKIELLQIGAENYDLNNYGVFTEIKSLQMLSLYNMENLKNINVLFPNLQEVTIALYLNNNKHLVDLVILDSINIPELPIQDTNLIKKRVTITGNPFLADCISPYICKVLETYPDSALIQNNGPNCEKEQLLHDCLTSSDQEELTQTISFFPNPVFDKLYWKEEEVIHQLDIFDLSGKVLYSIQRPSSGLDISHLDGGVYLVKMQTQNQSFTSRICVVK